MRKLLRALFGRKRRGPASDSDRDDQGGNGGSLRRSRREGPSETPYGVDRRGVATGPRTAEEVVSSRETSRDFSLDVQDDLGSDRCVDEVDPAILRFNNAEGSEGDDAAETCVRDHVSPDLGDGDLGGDEGDVIYDEDQAAEDEYYEEEFEADDEEFEEDYEDEEDEEDMKSLADEPKPPPVGGFKPNGVFPVSPIRAAALFAEVVATLRSIATEADISSEGSDACTELADKIEQVILDKIDG